MAEFSLRTAWKYETSEDKSITIVGSASWGKLLFHGAVSPADGRTAPDLRSVTS
jgi:hypothetical protein